ncbi:Uncharacterised protein [Mycobacteroides abscessus subsp. abscessus]|nr:Uncharacterised protein [Mycobacteroides abscessus subsp. abscessus]
MRVLDVVDRVLTRRGRPQLQINVDRGVHRGTDQRIASRIHADGVYQVVEGDDGPRALGHAHRLAITHQVDHLTDKHLNTVGVVTQCGGNGFQARDIPVMIGTEHVDAQVEAPLALVEVIGDITGDVGGVAVALDDDTILVVTEVARPQPGRAVLLVDVSGLAQLGDGLLHPA